MCCLLYTVAQDAIGFFLNIPFSLRDNFYILFFEFQKLEEERDEVFDDDKAKETYYARRVLTHPGEFVTARNCVKMVTSAHRADATKRILTFLSTLKDKNMLKLLKNEKTSFFQKQRDVANSALLAVSITKEKYTASFLKVGKMLSERQKAQFLKTTYPQEVDDEVK